MSRTDGVQAQFVTHNTAPQEAAAATLLVPVRTGLAQVHTRIAAACSAAGRTPESVQLIAVSKTCPAGAVRAALAAGQQQFGENYVQEGVEKITALASLQLGGALNQTPEWHFIGPLQTNKTRVVAEHFAWVHGIDRLKIAERLSTQRPPNLPLLNVCIQINVDGEASKRGVAPSEAAALARAIAGLPNLKLRGLMSIPEPVTGLDAQRAPHRALRQLLERLNRESGAPVLTLDTLSMGMSADLEAAILEGATMVRIGTAIFGARHYPQNTEATTQGNHA